LKGSRGLEKRNGKGAGGVNQKKDSLRNGLGEDYVKSLIKLGKRARPPLGGKSHDIFQRNSVKPYRDPK